MPAARPAEVGAGFARRGASDLLVEVASDVHADVPAITRARAIAAEAAQSKSSVRDRLVRRLEEGAELLAFGPVAPTVAGDGEADPGIALAALLEASAHPSGDVQR